MADKVSDLSLSDLITGKQKSDSMEQDYVEVSQARDEASSPTAQLIERRKQLLINTFKKETAERAGLPEAGEGPASIKEPGIEMPALRKTGAAPLPTGGVDPRTGETIPAITAAGEPGRDIVPSVGEAIKSIPGGVFDAIKGLLRLPQEAAAMVQGFNDSMLKALVDAKGEVPVDIQQKLDEARSKPDPDAQAARVLAKVADRFPEIAQPESIGGSLIRGFSAFLAPFGVARKVTKDLPVVKKLLESSGTLSRAAGRSLDASLAGIPADIVAFDPAGPRFSNLVNTLHPSLKNPVTEFLAAPERQEGEELKMEDRFKERLKGAAEGLVVGGLIDSLATAVIAARRYARVAQASRRLAEARVVRPVKVKKEKAA